jgi:Dockerin type I domain/BNR/Asp-box repeat
MSLFAVAISLTLLGAEPGAPIEAETPHEPRVVGPWILPDYAPARRPVLSRNVVRRGDRESIQINIDALGENIVGDAGNEPSFIVDPSAPNRLLVGWRQFDSIASNFPQAAYGYSVDGGRRWAFPGVLIEGIARTDPVLNVDSQGVFYYYSLSHINEPFFYYLHRSDDRGESWSDGVYAFGHDKGWLAIDRTGGPGDGNLYMHWSLSDARFSLSRDGGQTFSEPAATPIAVGWGTLAVGLQGELYIAGSRAGTFFVQRSSDAPHDVDQPTFEMIREVGLGGSERKFTGPNPGGLLGQVWIAVDESDGPARGNVYVLSPAQQYGSEDPLDLMFSRSEDRGETWSFPVRINDDPLGSNHWQYFGALSIAPTGRLDVVWYDTRGSGQTNLSEVYYSYSTDGGRTWSANEAVSPPFDTHLGWPQQEKIGDYIQCSSDALGVNVIYTATFNGEQDLYYLRLGARDCNGNGIADVDDLAGLTSSDCNGNGIPDECEVAAGAATDGDGNGVLDECEFPCPGDVDGDLDVDQADMGLLLRAFEQATGDPLYDEQADFNNDGVVDQADLGILLANYETVCD